MQKREVVIILLSLLIFLPPITANSDDGPTSAGTGAMQGDFSTQVNQQLPDGYSVGAGTTGQQNADGSYTITGSLTTPNGMYTGDSIVIDTNGNIINFGTLTFPNGAKANNGHGLTQDGKNQYQIDGVGSLEQGQITITNGVNVQWNNGVMTADSAEVMDYQGSTSITVNGLRADGREFSVGRAEAVQAGCFLVADVENARFSLGSTVKMTTSGNGKVVYDEDAAIDFKALQPNSSLTGSMTNCRKPTYAVQAMQLVAHKLNITDIINGTGTFEVDPAFGVVCVNLTPISTYDLDFGGYEDDFGFLAKEYAYKICVQKTISQKLAADCALCGLVDLLSKKIILNGVIEYRRYWFDSALIEKEKQRAFRSLGWGKNVLDFGNGQVLIEQDAPGIGTHVSNYLELHEHDAGGVTHRFLGVNEKVERVARNWARQYSAAYAPATTTIVDNHFDYQRGNCHVAVLPPNSPQVNAVLSAISEQGVRYR